MTPEQPHTQMHTARRAALLEDLSDAREELEQLPRRGLSRWRVLVALVLGIGLYATAVALGLGAFWKGAALSTVLIPVVQFVGHRIGPPLALHDSHRELELKTLISDIEEELTRPGSGPTDDA